MEQKKWNYGHQSESWRRMPWPVKVLLVLILVGMLFGALGLATLLLWNWLMPEIFRLPAIGFWQALGLLALGQLLFRGFHTFKGGHRHWKRQAVWKNLREEESSRM